jgi:MFS family permease
VVGHLWRKPAFRHLLAGFVLAGFTLNAMANFVMPFYLRGFGLPLATVAALFGAVSFVSNGLGMLIGGFGFDRLARRDPRWAMWAPAVALLVCIPIYVGAFVSLDIYASLACIFFGNLALATHMAPTSATIQNMVGPRMRATTSAIVALVVGVLSAGLGPSVAGYLSDGFAESGFAAGDFFAMCPGGRAVDGMGTALDAACQSASTEGLRLALLSVLVAFVWAALHYGLAARDLRQDLYRPDAE